VVGKAPRKGAHRRKRERRPLLGMMLHQDGSRHAWLEGQPPLDLIVTLDAATGEIYSAFLIEEEGAASTFRALKEVFGKHGLPMSLYTDRGGHYFFAPEAGGEVDRNRLTQVGRALKQLGVEHIGAYSPQARGRSERMFGPCRTGWSTTSGSPGSPRSKRPTSSSARSICPSTMRASPRRRLSRAAPSPRSPGSISTRFSASRRSQVGNDSCVSFRTLQLQIPESPMRPHFVKARVKVHLYPDGSHAVFHGPRCIGRYDEKGRLNETLRAA